MRNRGEKSIDKGKDGRDLITLPLDTTDHVGERLIERQRHALGPDRSEALRRRASRAARGARSIGGTGTPSAACARLASLLDPPDPQNIAVTWALPLLAWAYGDLGELKRAERLAKQAVVLATKQEQRLALLDALRVSALVAIRTRRWPEAAAALQEAIALARAMHYPYAEAKAHSVYGQLHAARGEPERARERYEAALAICARLGERLYAGHIEQALAH
jgi:tetratricopeptide (TPR) repeat protein